MGVPTMYSLMIKYFDETYGSASEDTKEAIKEQLQKMRYMYWNLNHFPMNFSKDF